MTTEDHCVRECPSATRTSRGRDRDGDGDEGESGVGLDVEAAAPRSDAAPPLFLEMGRAGVEARETGPNIPSKVRQLLVDALESHFCCVMGVLRVRGCGVGVIVFLRRGGGEEDYLRRKGS